jgi:hypothetical protein
LAGRKDRLHQGPVQHHLYFAISTCFSVASYYAGGLFVQAVFALTIVILPSYAIGLFFGSKLFGFARESTFRIICYTLIGASALLGMPALDGIAALDLSFRRSLAADLHDQRVARTMNGRKQQSREEGEVIDEESELRLVALQRPGPWKAKARNMT